MVIVDKVREDFYKHICRKHVLVLCGIDVDALCACKILQAMFKADDVEHTVIPVAGKQDIKTAYKEHAHLVKCIVLINCGGRLNLMEFLQPEPDEIKFYIIDSHRPLELDNVYNEDQVTIVLREGDKLNVPEFDQLYSYEMEEEDEEEECYSDQDEPQAKRSRTDEKNSYEARRLRHLWRRKREELLYNYYELDYHETAASLVMYELACQLNRDGNEPVWLAIVGLTEQLLYEKISTEVYWDDAFKLQQSVRRHNRSDGDAPSAINLMRLSFDNELKLSLYRHWTLNDSLRHSEYTVVKFKIWSVKGQKKLLEFLATMGMPISQAEQKFPSMELQFRENIKELIDESSSRFSLENCTYASFVAQFGYKTTLCAADIVYSSTALMEDVEVTYSEAFFRALDALSIPKSNLHLVHEGIELAKEQQIAIMGQVRNFLDTHKVVCAGPFLYAYVEEGTPNVKMFSKVLTLGRLARFVRECWVVTNKKARDMPFIVTTPLDSNVDDGMCLVLGVPPHTEDNRRSEFSRAFEHAANRIQAHASFDNFSGSVVEIKKEERGKFLDALIALAAT